MARICFIAALILVTFTAKAQENVTITVTNLRTNSGQVIIQAFDNHQNFKDSKPIAKFKVGKKGAVNGKLTMKCTLKPGIYGLALLDDENASGKMDNNMVGMPKEGFGFSNYYHTGMTRPKLDDFKIEVKDQPLKVEMKVRYL